LNNVQYSVQFIVLCGFIVLPLSTQWFPGEMMTMITTVFDGRPW